MVKHQYLDIEFGCILSDLNATSLVVVGPIEHLTLLKILKFYFALVEEILSGI